MREFLGNNAQAITEPLSVTRMPDPQDPRVIEATRRKRDELMRRSGRLSTIMSDNLRETIGAKGLIGA